jgi:phage FluMu protein Com
VKEWRCPHCGKLLFKGDFVGLIEIRCDRGTCREWVTLTGSRDERDEAPNQTRE